MILAQKGTDRVFPEKGDTASCPACGGKVLAKCGEINIWHWAHEVADCDPWSEGESEWHVKWKDHFPVGWREVVIGDHRADLSTPIGVIELQHSPISPDVIAERERFYDRMVWVVDGREFWKNIDLRNRGGYVSFRWKWPRKTWVSASRPIFIDPGGGWLLNVKKIHPGTPCGGWGNIVGKDKFLRRYYAGSLL
jgi:hypothetical protein